MHNASPRDGEDGFDVRYHVFVDREWVFGQNGQVSELGTTSTPVRDIAGSFTGTCINTPQEYPEIN